jgi:cell division protein FtsZ
LHSIYGDLPARQAFKMADNIITTAVKGVAEIITVHGNVNIDYADVKTVMQKSSVFIMGTGYAIGEGRAMEAVNMALESPLLDSNDIFGTKNILLNIISGKAEVTIGEIGEIIETLQERAGQEADIIWGNGYDESLGDKISVTILATGFVNNPNKILQPRIEPEKFELNQKTIEEEPVLEEKPEPDFAFEFETSVPEPDFQFETKTRNVQEKVQEKLYEESTSIFSRMKKAEKKKTKAGEPVSENVDNWFMKNFGLNRFFDDDDDDQPMK